MAKVPIFITKDTAKEKVEKAIFAQLSGQIFRNMSATDKASVAAWMKANYADKSGAFPVPTSLPPHRNLGQERRMFRGQRATNIIENLKKARKTITESGQEIKPAQLKGMRLMFQIARLMKAMANKQGDARMSRAELQTFQTRLNAMIAASGVSEDYANLARMIGAPGGLKDPIGAARNRRFY